MRLLRADRGPCGPEAAEPAKPRLSKGEKRGTKKEATVTAAFTFDPEPRAPDEVVRVLMKRQTPEEREQARQQRQQRRLEGRAPPRASRNKHLRATLTGKEIAFAHLMEQVGQRDPGGDKPRVVLLDGDAALEERLHEQLRAHHLEDRLDAIILDIIHASEYVWEVGTALYGERNPRREVWVAREPVPGRGTRSRTAGYRNAVISCASGPIMPAWSSRSTTRSGASWS